MDRFSASRPGLDLHCLQGSFTVKWLKHVRWLIVLGAGMMLGAFAPNSWLQASGLDFWNLPTLRAEIAANERLSEAMDVESRLLLQRIEVKDRLVKDLLQGRTNLAAVTSQFHELNGDDPEMFWRLRECFHVKDGRQLAARNVLAFAETQLDSEANHANKPAVMERLDREYNAMFAQ
jgi:plasmid maintenance system antidote protein VapI